MSQYEAATVRSAIDYLDGIYREAVVRGTIKDVYVSERPRLVSNRNYFDFLIYLISKQISE
jgi:hypothetical protein